MFGPVVAEHKINKRFAQLADQESINRAINSLKNANIAARFVPTRREAKRAVLGLIPRGSQVMTMTSQTLEALGLATELNETDHYQSVRAELKAHGNGPHPIELKAKANLPDYVVGSAHAVTQDGKILIASYSGSQLAAYVYGADHVVYVVGAQKVVRDLDEGLKRIYEYSYPNEDRRIMQAFGIHSFVSKILIINREIVKGRITMTIVGEKLGF